MNLYGLSKNMNFTCDVYIKVINLFISQVVVNYRIWPSSKCIQYHHSKFEAVENLITSIKGRFQ